MKKKVAKASVPVNVVLDLSSVVKDLQKQINDQVDNSFQVFLEDYELPKAAQKAIDAAVTKVVFEKMKDPAFVAKLIAKKLGK